MNNILEDFKLKPASLILYQLCKYSVLTDSFIHIKKIADINNVDGNEEIEEFELSMNNSEKEVIAVFRQGKQSKTINFQLFILLDNHGYTNNSKSIASSYPDFLQCLSELDKVRKERNKIKGVIPTVNVIKNKPNKI